jgi:hypothetical protein
VDLAHSVAKSFGFDLEAPISQGPKDLPLARLLGKRLGNSQLTKLRRKNDEYN